MSITDIHLWKPFEEHDPWDCSHWRSCKAVCMRTCGADIFESAGKASVRTELAEKMGCGQCSLFETPEEG